MDEAVLVVNPANLWMAGGLILGAVAAFFFVRRTLKWIVVFILVGCACLAVHSAINPDLMPLWVSMGLQIPGVGLLVLAVGTAAWKLIQSERHKLSRV